MRPPSVEPPRHLVPVLLALALASCGPSPLPSGEVDPWTLQRGLAECGRVEVTVPDEPTADELRARFPALLGEEGPELAFLATGEPGEPTAARVVVGGLSDPDIAALAARVGAELLAESGGFRLLGRTFDQPGDAVRAVFEDPAHPGRPLTLWFGNEEPMLLAYFSDPRPRWRPMLRAWQSGELSLACPLAPDGTPRVEELVETRPVQEELLGMAPSLQVGPLRFTVVGNPRLKRLGGFAKNARLIHLKVKKWLAPLNTRGLHVVVYSRPEDLAKVTGREELGSYNPVGATVHVLLSDSMLDDRGQAVARGTALAVAGAPAAEWMLDGVAVGAAGTWWGQPLDVWVGHLMAGGFVPEVEELVDPAATEKLSPHILQPLRGFLLQLLIEERGAGRVEALWNGAVPFQTDRLLMIAWRRALQEAKAKANATLHRTSAQRRAAALQGPFRYGVALMAGAGAGQGDGYLHPELMKSLARARDVGANALSVTVFAAHDPTREPEAFTRGRPVWGSASDLALATAVAAGREAGLRATLVLEPLASPTGMRELADTLHERDDWEAFFVDFRAMAVHYGLLAELLGCEVMCLGTELGKTAWTVVTDPEAPDTRRRTHLLEGWKGLIAEVRGAFGGALTYGVRGAGEAVHVAFWEDLDFIGLLLFPAWKDSEFETPTRERVRGGYRSHLQLLTELGIDQGRPWLVLQTGFPSAAHAFPESWVPAGPPDPAAQVLALEQLAQALDNGGRSYPGLGGFFLWSWSTDPTAGGPDDRGFTPQNKAAEEILPLLFGK